MGPLLDGIHSRVGLLKYDVSPVSLLGLFPTSLLVPVLLAAFYIVLGSLVLLLDDWFLCNGNGTTEAIENAHGGRVALAFGYVWSNLIHHGNSVLFHGMFY